MLVLFRACFFVLLVLRKSKFLFLCFPYQHSCFYCFLLLCICLTSNIFILLFSFTYVFFTMFPFFIATFHCCSFSLIPNSLVSGFIFHSSFILCLRSCSFVLCYVTTVIHLLLFHFLCCFCFCTDLCKLLGTIPLFYSFLLLFCPPGVLLMCCLLFFLIRLSLFICSFLFFFRLSRQVIFAMDSVSRWRKFLPKLMRQVHKTLRVHEMPGGGHVCIRILRMRQLLGFPF